MLASHCVAAVLAAAVGPAMPATAAVTELRVKLGDDPAWAAPGLDDRDWALSRVAELDAHQAVVWLRASVPIEPGPQRPRLGLGLRVMALASCQAYWDGAPVGANGVVGATAEDERPGEIDWVTPLPPVPAGAHELALRCSTHHRGFEPRRGFYVIEVGDYAALARVGIGYAASTLVFAGALLAVGVFYVLTFLLGGRRSPHLWLGLFATAAVGLIVVEGLRALVGYTYDRHSDRLIAITALALAVNALLIGFVLARFPMTGRRFIGIGFAGLAALCLMAPGYDSKSALLFLLGLLVALGWVVRALWQRQLHAGFAAAGLVLCLGAAVWWPARFLDYYLFSTLSVLSLFLLTSHVIASARDDRRRDALELRSARLEIELLRRQLQPHFLMNTLTALSEHVEQSPADAAEMIEHLGNELRILAEVSSQRLIPLDTELALCRSHLEVMARRRAEALALDAGAPDGSLLVPPAVLHTLVENALTHNDYRHERAVFTLRCDAAGRRVRLMFDAPLRRSARTQATGTGTGLRYVRARLRESFGDDHELHGEATVDDRGDAVWRTIIEFPRKEAR